MTLGQGLWRHLTGGGGASADHAAAAKVAFDRLPARTRQILLLRRAGQLSYCDIAARLDISAADVEQQIAMAVSAIAAGMYGAVPSRRSE